MKRFVLLSVLMIPQVFAQSSSSTLGSACKQPGYSCGECESNLQNDMNSLLSDITGGALKQKEHWGDSKESTPNSGNISMKPGTTLEGTLKNIIDLMKKNNTGGDGTLNFVTIAESESLQGSSVRNGKVYPRVMLKSPNSELMVTFNTDPQAKGYNTLEIMRWNGKQGRYEFQELSFNQNGSGGHVDLTGQKCVECHKENPRPNWDTYRAWAGVVPSRDDMLEMNVTDGQFDQKKGMQPDARAYLNFLDQVADAKDKKTNSRLAFLDIPFDTKRQLGPYVEAAGKTRLTEREKVDIIKQRVQKDGFYRIRHQPDKEEVDSRGNSNGLVYNFDGKTAPYAGPSQFAFDQMLSQNMCKVTTDLKKNPNWDKFKYGMALLAVCGKEGSMENVYPPSFKDRLLNHYQKSSYGSLQDIEPNRRPSGRLPAFSDLRQAIYDDTEASHNAANGFKFNRHGRFLNKYLTEVERVPADAARTQAQHYSQEVVTPTNYNGWHAIGDVGGVRGVPEDSTDIMTDTRMLLEPFGVQVGHWSLVHGKSNAYNSFSFSDQFVLFKTQPIWKELLDEAGSCSELEVKAKEALQNARLPGEESTVSGLEVACGEIGRGIPDSVNGGNIADIGKVLIEQIKPEMKADLRRCVTCHGPGEDDEFPGLSDFVSSSNEQEFVNFLKTGRSRYYNNRPILEIVQMKMGLVPMPQEDLGEPMPPQNWKIEDRKAYAAKHGIKEEEVYNYRRQKIGMYLNFIGTGGDRDKMKQLCDQVIVDQYIKDFTSPGTTSGTGSSSAGGQ